MKFPKKNKSNRFLVDIAMQCHNSGIVVDWGSDCDDWVSIEDKNDTDNSVFMQGDDASEFIQGIESMARKYRSFDEYTCALILAWPYAENCFN